MSSVPRTPGFVMGLGMAVLLDGVVLHQIFQWHAQGDRRPAAGHRRRPGGEHGRRRALPPRDVVPDQRRNGPSHWRETKRAGAAHVGWKIGGDIAEIETVAADIDGLGRVAVTLGA
jgi:hypothetical protein